MNKHTAALLEQHFDTAFNAPDGLKKLRELILTLAMQGKLVPQDPSDPPASALLKEIEAEKKRLVKEGKMKTPKPLPPVTEEEKPYALPQGWEWVRLGEITNVSTGKLDANAAVDDGEFPFFTCSNKPSATSTYSFDTEAVLLAGNGDFNLKKYSGKFDAYQRTYVIEPILLSLDFLFRGIQEIIYAITKNHRGSAIPYLRLADITHPLFPIPPLPEQHRIVAKIDELMARCDALEKLRTAQNEKRLSVHAAAIGQLLNIAEPAQHQRAQAFLAEHFGDLYTVKENVAELRKAILQLAVMGKLVPQNPNDPPASALLKEIEAEKKRLVKEGKIKTPKLLPPVTQEEKPYALPQGWEWVRMGDICWGVTSGATPQKEFFSEVSGVPFLKVYNIRDQKIDFEYKKQFVDINYHRSKMGRSTLVPGDVVMNIVGPPLGKVAVIPDDYPEYNCNQAIVVFRPVKKETNRYLYVYLLAGTFLNAIELVGTAGQDNISVTKSQMMPIPFPHMYEQHRIVAKIDELMALCDSFDQQIDAATAKQAELLDAVMAQV